MRIEWDAAKNRLLWGARKIGFEVVEQVLEEGTYEIRAHPDRERHPNQILLIFEFRAYTWVCPAVRSADVLTLKTVTRRGSTIDYGGSMTELQYLDEEERTIVSAIEDDPRVGEGLDAREEALMRETLAQAARRERKDAKITLRLPAGDLLAIKAKARRLGVDYQPLIAELIHQYAAGELRRID